MFSWGGIYYAMFFPVTQSIFHCSLQDSLCDNYDMDRDDTWKDVNGVMFHDTLSVGA